jgi:small-conductance mechanosensitive channel
LISLLLELAVAHPAVISNPKPEAYFLGFGESALNFELRFWTYQEEWFQLKSDVAVHLVKALREANIEVPFPQRDLHIRSSNSSVGEHAATAESSFDAAAHQNRADPAQVSPAQSSVRDKILRGKM